MKKIILLMVIVLTVLLSSNFQLIVGGEGDSDAEESSSDGWWWLGGNWNGTLFNYSGIKIFPPHEGNGVDYRNLSYIQTDMSNSVIFSLNLITIPNVKRIEELGEYLIQYEKIVAINFSKKDISNEINYSVIIFKLYSPEGELLISQELNLNSNITILSTPFILNSSGLWKIKIDFVLNPNSEDFQVWENISKWYSNDDKYYLTFILNENLSFENYYEKIFPIYSLSEINGYWQALLTLEQEIYLSKTVDVSERAANASEKSASASERSSGASENSSFWTMIAAIIAAIAAGLSCVAITIAYFSLRQSKQDKKKEKEYKTKIANHLGDISTYLEKISKEDKVKNNKIKK